jgi:hypothetical protein
VRARGRVCFTSLNINDGTSVRIKSIQTATLRPVAVRSVNGLLKCRANIHHWAWCSLIPDKISCYELITLQISSCACPLPGTLPLHVLHAVMASCVGTGSSLHFNRTRPRPLPGTLPLHVLHAVMASCVGTGSSLHFKRNEHTICQLIYFSEIVIT